MIIILSIGVASTVIGITLMAARSIRYLRNPIFGIWPKWKKVSSSIAKMESERFLSIHTKELFLSFEEYFQTYIKDKKQFRSLSNLGIYMFELWGSQMRVFGVFRKQHSEYNGPDWDQFVKTFYEERESKIITVGLILSIVGTVLMAFAFIF